MSCAHIIRWCKRVLYSSPYSKEEDLRYIEWLWPFSRRNHLLNNISREPCVRYQSESMILHFANNAHRYLKVIILVLLLRDESLEKKDFRVGRHVLYGATSREVLLSLVDWWSPYWTLLPFSLDLSLEELWCVSSTINIDSRRGCLRHLKGCRFVQYTCMRIWEKKSTW